MYSKVNRIKFRKMIPTIKPITVDVLISFLFCFFSYSSKTILVLNRELKIFSKKKKNIIFILQSSIKLIRVLRSSLQYLGIYYKYKTIIIISTQLYLIYRYITTRNHTQSIYLIIINAEKYYTIICTNMYNVGGFFPSHLRHNCIKMILYNIIYLFIILYI